MILGLQNKRPNQKMNDQTAAGPLKESAKALFSDLIDYAGLFPPSQVSMPEAVMNYATYKNSNYSWMLGRFITPAARLDEFLESASDLVGRDAAGGWRISVLAGEDINDTVKRIKRFNAENAPRFAADTLEVKAATVSKIDNTVNILPEGVTAYFEVAMSDKFSDLVSTLSLKGQRAKIRTGGVVHEAFPSSREVIRFVRTCTAANVPFKATAGLHHPLRCFKPLTYASDAPHGTMHGFLNLLLMTGFARQSFRVGVLEEIMEDEFEEAFTFEDGGVRWRGENFLTNAQITRLREKGFNSFGSCSFDEPIADLRSFGLL